MKTVRDALGELVHHADLLHQLCLAAAVQDRFDIFNGNRARVFDVDVRRRVLKFIQSLDAFPPTQGKSQ